MRRLWLPLVVLLAPSPASAHLVGVELGPFYAGAMHVFSGVEYLAVFAALALLSALSPRKAAGPGLLLVPLGVLAGGLASLATSSVAGGLTPMLAVAMVAGGLAALALIPAPALFLPLLAVSAAVLGFSNAQALGDSLLSGPLYVVGATLAAATAHALATALLTAGRGHLGSLGIAYRVMASWVAAFGAVTIALQAAG